MRHSATLHCLSLSAATASRGRSRRRWPRWVSGLLLAALMGLVPVTVQAASPDSAPAALREMVTAMDAAANSQDKAGVMKFFSPQLRQSDGLTQKSLEQNLTQFWKDFRNVKYQTTLKSWEKEGNAIIAETETVITGTQTVGDRTFQLKSTLVARQRLENQTIVAQEILSEATQLTSGDNPPTVSLQLPETVRPGQQFNFDAIVDEPLGDDLLLGAALDEPISPQNLLQSERLKLEALSSGGLFKVGRAPAKAGDRWLSAVIIRHDGITIVTRRLRVAR